MHHLSVTHTTDVSQSNNRCCLNISYSALTQRSAAGTLAPYRRFVEHGLHGANVGDGQPALSDEVPALAMQHAHHMVDGLHLRNLDLPRPEVALQIRHDQLPLLHRPYYHHLQIVQLPLNVGDHFATFVSRVRTRIKRGSEPEAIKSYNPKRLFFGNVHN